MYESKRKGAVSLATALILGTVILEIGIASAVLVFFLTSTGLSSRLSEEAFVAAQAGVNDVMLRLVRDKDFPTTSWSNRPVGTDFVDVQFTRDMPTINQHTIVAIGRALNKRRKLTAILEVEPVTGSLKVLSLSEGNLP
jgi:hypothetical protein